MGVVVVGLSHRTAPVDVRERVAFAESALEAAVRRAAELTRGEAMIVSTCNRVELYLAGDDVARDQGVGALRAEVEGFLAEVGGLAAATLAPHLYHRDGGEAVRHLFRVASSLDSMVVGEPQILGQVKAAFETARRAGTIGPALLRTVPRAFAVAKRVRSETEVARSSASIASAAVELARHIFGNLDGKDILIVGAGKMADLAARHLRSAGCRKLAICNRTHARAQELAARLDGEAHPWEQLEQLLGRADIVLCSTGAPRPVISRELVHRAMRSRRGRWLCFIDIAVPRDVEPEVGDLSNIYLYDVDALTHLVDENLADRRREAEHAERIVEEELGRFVAAERSLGVVPTIKALRERFHAVARTEAERALGRLDGAGANSALDRELRMMAESIVNKLLHAPLTALKRGAESEALVEAAHALFDLRLDASVPSAADGNLPIEELVPSKAAGGGETPDR